MGGRTSLLTKRKMAFSELRFMCWRISKMNLPTLMSAGTRYFFLSRSGTSLFGAFSTMTGMRSGYLARMRCATFCLSSAGRQRRGCVTGGHAPNECSFLKGTLEAMAARQLARHAVLRGFVGS